MHRRFYVIVCYVLLQYATDIVSGRSDPTQYSETHRGETGDSHIIPSPGFPSRSYTDDSIYIYRFSSLSNGFVRLIFTDYKPHDETVLKIYDGYDAYSSSMTWRLSSRPVYQSRTSHLYVVIKTGTFSHRNDVFYGWRMLVQYVQEYRADWAAQTDFPKLGYCSEFFHSTLHIQVPDTGGTVHGLDCAWNIKFSGYEGQTLAVIMPENGNLEVTVRDGPTSQDTARTYDSRNNNDVGVIRYYDVNNDDYVSIRGSLTGGSTIRMAHSERRSDALDNAQNARGSGHTPVCEFKDCRTFMSTTYITCVLYWISCGNDRDDESCETVDLDQCRDSDTCYDSSRDVCDGFNDCGDGYDEGTCKSSETDGAGTTSRSTATSAPETNDASTITSAPRSSIRLSPTAPRSSITETDVEAPPPSYDDAARFSPVASPDDVDPELPSYDRAIEMNPPPPAYDSLHHESAV